VPSVTRPRRLAPARREAIEIRVTEALERLLEQGETITALGVQRIADEAGISRSSFYVHFTDKVDLLARVSETATRELFAAAEWWVREGRDVASLERTALAVIAQRRAHARTLQAVDEVAAYEPAVAEAWRRRIGRFGDLLAARIAEDVATGLALPDVDPEPTARWIAWGTERTITEHVRGDDGAGDQRVARTTARVIWNAVYPADRTVLLPGRGDRARPEV
jgi:TetR/AcrR family transcriptional regulator, ethionamide resistance regulator